MQIFDPPFAKETDWTGQGITGIRDEQTNKKNQKTWRDDLETTKDKLFDDFHKLSLFEDRPGGRRVGRRGKSWVLPQASAAKAMHNHVEWGISRGVQREADHQIRPAVRSDELSIADPSPFQDLAPLLRSSTICCLALAGYAAADTTGALFPSVTASGTTSPMA